MIHFEQFWKKYAKSKKVGKLRFFIKFIDDHYIKSNHTITIMNWLYEFLSKNTYAYILACYTYSILIWLMSRIAATSFLNNKT